MNPLLQSKASLRATIYRGAAIQSHVSNLGSNIELWTGSPRDQKVARDDALLRGEEIDFRTAITLPQGEGDGIIER